MKAEGLPIEKYFKFNNSCLFENNHDISTKYCFEITDTSCKQLFDQIESMQSKSLKLTNEVISLRTESLFKAQDILINIYKILDILNKSAEFIK